jgi:hypothetical protein
MAPVAATRIGHEEGRTTGLSEPRNRIEKRPDGKKRQARDARERSEATIRVGG